MFKKALMILSGNAAGSALLFARNLLVSWLVSPENYGIASAFAMAMSIIELLSYVGLQQMIVVEPDGDDDQVQAAMQGFQVIRGVISSVLQFAIAAPFADFMGIGQAAWAFEVLALVPLISCFQHFDTHRLRRHMIFGPSVLGSAVPALVALLVIWPVAYLFKDYRIMLVSILVQTLVMVLVSHVTARRPYRMTLDMDVIRRAMIFGWPILANSILLFAVFNGERIIIGRELGMVEFALFSMAMTLTQTPMLVVASSLQSFALSKLGAARSDDTAFNRIGVATMEVSIATGVILTVGTALLGGPIVAAITDSEYEPVLAFLVPLIILHSIHSAANGTSIVGLGRSHAGIGLAISIFRVLSLPISWWMAVRTGDVLAIIGIATASELLGLALGLYLLKVRVGMNLGRLTLPLLLSGVTLFACWLDATYHPLQPKLLAQMHPTLLPLLMLGLAAIFSMTALRSLMRRLRPATA